MFNDHSQRKSFLALMLFVSVSFSLFFIYQHFSGPDDGEKGLTFNRDLIKDGKRSFSSFEGISFKENYADGTGILIKAAKADVRSRKMGFFRVAFGKVTEMEDVSFVLSDNGTELVSIGSDRATMFIGSQDVLFEGKVICSTINGETLKTEKIFWDKKTNIFETKDSYEYTDKNGVLKTGEGFKFDKEFNVIRFHNNFKTFAKKGTK